MINPRAGLILFVSLLLVALMALSVMTPRKGPDGLPEPFFNRSIYNHGPSGYRGWFLACRKAGLREISTWEKPFDALREAPYPATMLVVQPHTVGRERLVFGPEETDKLLNWVSRGNTLILLDDFRRHGSHALAKRLHLRLLSPKSTAKAPPKPQKNLPPQLLTVVERGPLAHFLRKPLISQSVTVLVAEEPSRYPGLKTLVEDAAHRPVMLRMPYGKGTLLLGGLPDLAENAYLHKRTDDNFQFLANVLASTGQPVLINEFVHGYVEINDLLSFYGTKTPLGAIFSQLAAAFLLLAWLGFTRWAPARRTSPHLADEENSGGLDGYINAMAGLALRSRAASLALTPQLARIDRLLHRRFGKTDSAEESAPLLPESFAREYSKEEKRDAAWEEHSVSRLNEALVTARKAIAREERLSHRELLRLSRMLNRIEERLAFDGIRSIAR